MDTDIRFTGVINSYRAAVFKQLGTGEKFPLSQNQIAQQIESLEAQVRAGTLRPDSAFAARAADHGPLKAALTALKL